MVVALAASAVAAVEGKGFLGFCVYKSFLRTVLVSVSVSVSVFIKVIQTASPCFPFLFKDLTKHDLSFCSRLDLFACDFQRKAFCGGFFKII